MQTGLSGKTILITGGANGIGRATALAFASEGAHVAIIDHDAKELASAADEVSAKGVRAYAVVGDLGSADGVIKSVGEVLARLPNGVDVLINNVGHADPKPFMEITDENWDRTFQLNFMSAVRVTRQVLPILRQKERAVILNNASDLARQPEAAPADYGALKGLLSLTKSLARSEAPKIRVNAVAPGPIWSKFWLRPGGFADGLAAIHNMLPATSCGPRDEVAPASSGTLGGTD